MSSGINNVIKTVLFIVMFSPLSAYSQTFFEAADGTGVLAFRRIPTSQIRLNLSEKMLTYGYYYADDTLTDPKKRLITLEVKLKPNDDGIATFIEKNRLQPGFELNAAYGIRNRKGLFNGFDVLDLYVKGNFKLNNTTIYDSTLLLTKQEPINKSIKGTGGAKLVLNYVVSSFSKFNIWLGAEVGYQRDINIGDLDDIQIQTFQLYPNDSARTIISNIKEAKKGPLEYINKVPLNIDLIFDPQLKLKIFGGSATNVTPALFSYLRKDFNYKAKQNRIGLGICFLGEKDPSKVMTSIGYQFPIFGSGVSTETRQEDKGIFFASIGFTFL
ncbi:hypothetical protein LX87_05547 [Larkinella arboricola]|uniref:Outer membrane beta-barrel porin/alpha-amylase n=1 Tax=Larkinella arboricola TaxID=643671 RepID=A0A327WJF2_LARAB|nr:hypothetical protein [Larkinella arboricola]RAJ90068.1 hypothetical protein LX87_05547 [Larkinella arboricola]